MRASKLTLTGFPTRTFARPEAASRSQSDVLDEKTASPFISMSYNEYPSTDKEVHSKIYSAGGPDGAEQLDGHIMSWS